MTTEQALEHYNKLTGSRILINDLKYLDKTSKALNALIEVTKMVERAGGELKSRQTMAAIIYFAENRD